MKVEVDKKKVKRKWWKEEVAYQIYPKSFYDSNGDGIGDLNGITEKLDYLNNLGVTLLWICPIFKSPMDDNGYDISDYYDIAPEFGTMEDLDNLIKKAKEKNIKIILDLVINHTSDEHEWFQKALKDPNSKYRDYYIFKRGKNGLPPTNWRSHFGGSVWEMVPNESDEKGNEMYYLHLFSKKQPDLNWEKPEIRKEIYKIVNYWLEKGISGFRVDAINSIKKDQRYLNLPVDGVDGLGFNIKYTLNQPGIEDFLEELADHTFRKYDCVTVAETPLLEYERFDRFIGENGFFSMTFDFNYADLDMLEDGVYYKRQEVNPKELKEKIFESQKVLQKYGWGAPFLENHDQPRSLNKYFGDKSDGNAAKLLGNLFLFLRGTPFIYQGQELGMDNFERDDIKEFDDIASKDQYNRALEEGFSKEEALYYINRRSRDNSRTPFHWDDTLNGGFSKNKKTWLKMIGTHDKTNAQSQLKNDNSVLKHYVKIIELRQKSKYSECLIYGEFLPMEFENDKIIGYSRKNDEYKLLCLNNFSDKDEEICSNILNKNEIKNIILNNYNELYERNDKIILKSHQSILMEI